jgi:transposase InsO family protein
LAPSRFLAALAIGVPILLLALLFQLPARHYGRRQPAIEIAGNPRRAPKPEWVRLEIIRLKALMPEQGCRKLADTFNRMHSGREETVGKTYVSGVVRKHWHEIIAQRRQVRNRRHKPTTSNRIWGLDLTFVRDEAERQYPLLGIVDHGTRANLALLPLKSKSAMALLRLLHAAITLYGKPRVIRTDNEGMFKSWSFHLVLRLWGIRHQLTDPHCPWQNGRIERFFGTFKERWKGWSVADSSELSDALHLFRTWYNHVRPHQHLHGMTPAEAWAGIEIGNRRPKEVIWFDAWDGLLIGYYIRR